MPPGAQVPKTDMEQGGGFPQWGMNILVDSACILKDGRLLNLPGKLPHSHHYRHLIMDSPMVRSIVLDLESWSLFSFSTRPFPWCPGAFQLGQAQAITLLQLCCQGSMPSLSSSRTPRACRAAPQGVSPRPMTIRWLVCSRCRTLHLSFLNFTRFLLAPFTSLPWSLWMSSLLSSISAGPSVVLSAYLMRVHISPPPGHW